MDHAGEKRINLESSHKKLKMRIKSISVGALLLGLIGSNLVCMSNTENELKISTAQYKIVDHLLGIKL
jgi:hypothetical protein